MSFRFCESMIHSYRTLGYVVFRQILPPSLIRDLRKTTARAHELARSKGGPQAQRLQPYNQLASLGVDLKAFEDYATLPPLVDAIHKILTPRHNIIANHSGHTGLLLEPADLPWCTSWHRDIRETASGHASSPTQVPDVEEFRRITVDPLWFNQVNCPLYEDNCTWYVPGSYLRRFDLEGETAAAANTPPELRSDDPIIRERAGIEYCERMPNAVRLSMDAGDFALYHPNGWHLGNYLPDRKRVTIHDFAPTPELLDWYERWHAFRKAAKL